MSYRMLRGLLITLGIFTVIVALVVQNQILSFGLVTLLSISAMLLLYTKMEVIMELDPESPRFPLLKNLSLAGLVYFGLCVLAALLQMAGLLTPQTGKVVVALLICLLMVGFGNLSPKVPYNKFIGLRLPWTLLDAQTWVVAHRLLGYLSFPLSFVYLALIPYVADFRLLTFCIFVVLWLGLPALLSGLFFLRKFPPKFPRWKQ